MGVLFLGISIRLQTLIITEHPSEFRFPFCVFDFDVLRQYVFKSFLDLSEKSKRLSQFHVLDCDWLDGFEVRSA